MQKFKVGDPVVCYPIIPGEREHYGQAGYIVAIAENIPYSLFEVRLITKPETTIFISERELKRQ